MRASFRYASISSGCEIRSGRGNFDRNGAVKIVIKGKKDLPESALPKPSEDRVTPDLRRMEKRERIPDESSPEGRTSSVEDKVLGFVHRSSPGNDRPLISADLNHFPIPKRDGKGQNGYSRVGAMNRDDHEMPEKCRSRRAVANPLPSGLNGLRGIQPDSFT